MSDVIDERLAARRRRFGRIRRTVASAAVASFIAAFATIYVQMATGNDPALGASSKAKATVVAASTSTRSSSDDSSGSSSAGAPATPPAAVTTRQS